MNKRVWIGLAVSLALLVSILYLIDPFGAQYKNKVSLSGDRRPAPTFKLKDNEGKTHRLSDFNSPCLLVHFWATWCPPCLEELPDIVKFSKKWTDREIKLILISLDSSWSEARKYLKDLTLPKHAVSLIDPQSKIPEKYGSYQFPETYLIGPEKKILTKWVGPQDWKNEFFQSFHKRVCQKDSTSS